VKPWVKNALKYGITCAICLVLTVSYVTMRVDLTKLGEVPAVMLNRVLCDGVTVPGIIVLMLGCLVWLSTQGALDGVGYLMYYAVKALIPGKRGDIERYGDYVERKRANRVTGYGFLIITGLVFMGFAAIFMILFYSVY
jgi:hypothetical protein